METFIEYYRLFKVSDVHHRFMPIILLLIGGITMSPIEAEEISPVSRESIGYLRVHGIAVTPHEKGDKFIPGQRIFKTKVGQKQSRTHYFHSTQMQVTYLEGKLVADHPEDWKFRSFVKETVFKDHKLDIQIVFQPQKERTSKATLVFKLKSKILGSNRVTVEIPLIGKGIVPAPKTAIPGDKIVPKTDEGPDNTKPRDTRVKNICLDFILVDNKDTTTWDKKAKEWTEKSNEIFKKSKVKIVFSKPKPVRRISGDDTKKEVDKATFRQLHCFPVFVVKVLPEEAPNASGYTDSEYIGDRGQIGKDADKLAGKHNIHQNYRHGMAYGTAIYILQNPDLSGVVLAHELGHTLGGGAGERNTHLDPEKGDPIESTDRLMNRENIRDSSPKISPLEKIIMEWTAEKFVIPTLAKCNETSKEYKSLIGDYGMIEHAVISNGGDELLLTTRLFEPLVTEGLFLDYRLSFDTDRDGVGDRMLINTYDGEAWNLQLEGVPPDVSSNPAVRFLRKPDGTAHAIAAYIPKAILQKSQGIIGWNILLEIPSLGITDSLPLFGQTCGEDIGKGSFPDLKQLYKDRLISSGGFDCFDIANPSLALQVASTEELIPAIAGDIFELEGSLVVSSTFSGEVDLHVGYLHPESGIMKEVLVKYLSEIQPEMDWTASVPVPSDLAPGLYQLIITAVCGLCQTETTAFGPTVSIGQFEKLPDLNLFPEPNAGQLGGSNEEVDILLNSKEEVEFQMPALR